MSNSAIGGTWDELEQEFYSGGNSSKQFTGKFDRRACKSKAGKRH